jgi:hypothetical protein
MENGFFKVQRRFFSHWLWEEDRTFSRAEAWLDMLQMAAFKDSKRLVNGKMISIPIGGIAASERFLGTRWKWSRSKVRAFLSCLVSDQMIDQQKDHGETVLILCNYKRYAFSTTDEKTTEEPPKDQRGTSDVPNKKKEKKEKKDSHVETQAIAWSSTGGFSGITDQDRKDWQEAYPACDINRQLAAMTEWLRSNPAKAKKKLWRRFVTGWLQRSQESGGDMRGSNRHETTSKPKPATDTGPEGWQDAFHQLHPNWITPVTWYLVDNDIREEIQNHLNTKKP